jgi:hypothetical protein
MIGEYITGWFIVKLTGFGIAVVIFTMIGIWITIQIILDKKKNKKH